VDPLERSEAGDAARFEAGLAEVTRRAAGELEGVHGPRSLSWRVYRESALFVAGLRALLLQIARPEVAAGVDQHSEFRTDPLGRAQRTFSLVYRLAFADLPSALRAARQIHARHRVVRGTVADGGGQPYRANDPELLFWVHATLMDSAEVAYQALVEPLSAAELDRLYEENRLSAAIFGIPPEQVPADRAAFGVHFEQAVSRLQIGPTARILCQALLAQLPGPAPLRRLIAALTAGMLPPPLRQPFGLPYDREAQRLAERWLPRISAGYRRLPQAVRFIPAYHEAMDRVSRRGEASTAGAVGARLWRSLTAMAVRSRP
jgi:uncharacterized protein (DUF2236 family)